MVSRSLKRPALLPVLAAGAAMLSGAAHAEGRLEGTFAASQTCPAYQAFRKQTNPGNVTVEPGKSYPLVAGNKPEPTYYWIEVEGASPKRRWVAATCGAANVTAGTVTPAAPRMAGRSGGAARYIFAASWQAAFCEQRPNKAECASQTQGRADASSFSLHGLWPQPRTKAFCNVSSQDRAADRSGRWDELPAPTLSQPTRAALDRVMPGTQSHLERHEWARHGTCYEADAEKYFTDAITLIDELNASPVRKLFADNIGKELTADQIRAAFDQGFGAGAGQRVRIACSRDGNRRLISEITIGLGSAIEGKPDLGALMASSSSVSAGCASGVVDPVGAQ